MIEKKKKSKKSVDFSTNCYIMNIESRKRIYGGKQNDFSKLIVIILQEIVEDY